MRMTQSSMNVLENIISILDEFGALLLVLLVLVMRGAYSRKVVDKIGYQDVGYFTALFMKLLSTSPREYRTTVRAKLFTVD